MIYFLYITEEVERLKNNEKDIKREKIPKYVQKEKKDYFLDLEKELHHLDVMLRVTDHIPQIRDNQVKLNSIIDRLNVIKFEKEVFIKDLKTFIKAQAKSLEIAKSKHRQKLLKDWQTEMEAYIPSIKEKFVEFKNEPSMNKAIMQQLIKDMKPEKPTKNDLDDLANIETEEQQRLIYHLEKQLIDSESEREAVQLKLDKYTMMYYTVKDQIKMLEKEYSRSN